MNEAMKKTRVIGTKSSSYHAWKKTGLEQWQYANLLGISGNTMNSYFNSRILPSVMIAKKMVKVLNELNILNDQGKNYTLDDIYADVAVYEPGKDFVPNRSQKYVTPEFMQHREERRRMIRGRKAKQLVTPEHKSVLEVQIEFEEKRRKAANIEM